jgi:hypothetical protein
MYMREWGLRYFDKNMIVKTIGSNLEEAILKTHLQMGKSRSWST